MEIWLDTCDVDFVRQANNLGFLQGVTTNPSILSLSKVEPKDLIIQLLEVQKGYVAVQVLSNDINDICKQAKVLSSLSNRILVKIPATQNGFRAIHVLTQEGIPTLATAIFDLRQALFAFKSGALYLAPYLGRIKDTGQDPIQIVSQMCAMKLQYGFEAKIMGAGIRDLSTAMSCIEMGICALTLSEKVLTEFLTDNASTIQALEKFNQDWSTSIFSADNFII